MEIWKILLIIYLSIAPTLLLVWFILSMLFPGVDYYIIGKVSSFITNKYGDK